MLASVTGREVGYCKVGPGLHEGGDSWLATANGASSVRGMYEPGVVGTTGVGALMVMSERAIAFIELTLRVDKWRRLLAEGPSSSTEAATPDMLSLGNSPSWETFVMSRELLEVLVHTHGLMSTNQRRVGNSGKKVFHIKVLNFILLPEEVQRVGIRTMGCLLVADGVSPPTACQWTRVLGNSLLKTGRRDEGEMLSERITVSMSILGLRELTNLLSPSTGGLEAVPTRVISWLSD